MVLEKKKQIVDGIDGAEENKENQPQNPVRYEFHLDSFLSDVTRI